MHFFQETMQVVHGGYRAPRLADVESLRANGVDIRQQRGRPLPVVGVKTFVGILARPQPRPQSSLGMEFAMMIEVKIETADLE